MPQLPSPPGPVRFLGAVFGLVFGGIGLTVIGFLWTAGGLHEPPFVFKLFGSFIALAFVAVGGTLIFGTFHSRPASIEPDAAATSAPAAGSGYACPSCGARLDKATEVSPKGDVKCGYCSKWFNIHG